MRRILATLGLAVASSLGAVFVPLPAAAQTILNTERFQLREVSGFHVSADLSANGQRGNSRILTVNSSGMTGLLTGRHWPRVIFGARYLSTRETALLDSRFVQLRYSYILDPRLRTFHFVQLQRTETLRLRSRWLLGSGIRRTLFEAEHGSFDLGTGLMGEWEELQPDAVGPEESTSLRALRMANLAVFSRDFASGARILNILYFQPDVSDFGDLRLLNDLGLFVPLTEHVRLTASVEWRRDTRPPGELESDDLSFSFGVGIDMR
jgi:hypothetical protein